MMISWSFDVLLGVTLLWFAWRTIFAHSLFESILSFIAFGMMLAMVWLRLGSVDVALAEAVLGSGITGALLLAAFNRVEREKLKQLEDKNDHS